MRERVEFKLVPNYQRHLGHCQVTYYAKNNKGQKLIYCLQDNGKNFGGVRLMRCSQDGEPSHEVTFSRHGFELVFQVPTDDDSTCKLVNDWIKRLEKHHDTNKKRT